MLVSFCVIAYNEEKALDSLFKDIIAQDYPHGNIEVILVNAMSTDQTRRKMEHFSEEDHGFRRVVVLDNAKKIQAAGWNVAITASKGDIILRIDAHTMIPHDFVSKNVQCILSGENVTGGRRPNVVEEETPWKHTLLLAESSMFGSSIAPYRKGNHKTYVKSVFHGAYRKEVFEKAGLFNENLGRTEDNEMHYRIRKAGYKICFNPDIISYQNIRNSWCGMLKQKYGKIINISSVVGVHGNAGQINYSASKAGIIGMTKSMAKELGAKGICVNAIAPGFIQTDMTDVLSDEVKDKIKTSIPMGKLGNVDDIAQTVAFLASDAASYITGQVIGVDGGMGM